MQEFDFKYVDSRFAQSADDYANAEPFPHMVFNDLFDASLLRKVSIEFPDPIAMNGRFRGVEQGGKSYLQNFDDLGPNSQKLVAALNSGPFLRSLSKLTSISNLISDPYLAGGGLHQTSRGGRLKIHADFNFHTELKLARRVNVLIYLNENWDVNWGGNLELWDQAMRRPVVSVPPFFGTVVIFTCTNTSFHGLPDDLKCPEGMFRKSVAMYYYTVPEENTVIHSTLWQERPHENFMDSPLVRIRNSAPYFYRGFRTLFKGKV